MTTRKRSEERAKAGLVMRAFEMTTEVDGLVNRTADVLSEREGRKVSRVRALDLLIREGAKKLLK